MIKKEHVINESNTIVCASAEAEKRIFKKIIKDGRVWYIAIQEDAASNIYVANEDPEKNKKSEGFAGRFISFELEDGTIDKVQGPWQSNSNSLHTATGYDVRDKHYTYGVIGEDIEFEGDWYNQKVKFINVWHLDEKPVLGSFYRINEKAQELANNLNKKMYYYVKTPGGSQRAWKDPEN